VLSTASAGSSTPVAFATCLISFMLSTINWRVPGRLRSTPNGASANVATAPNDPSARNLLHSATQTSSGTTAVSFEACSASRSRSTRSLARLSHSPNVNFPSPPMCRTRPGPSRNAMISTAPGSTASCPTTSATWRGASTPFCVVMTAVPSPISGLSVRTAASSCQVFTPSNT
jgi:hypothetical protein